VSGPLGLLLVAVLIAANGMFVAAEFALVSLRRPAVEERASSGDRRARIVRRELRELSFALSSAQFGITATSLLLGFVAERALGDAVIRPLLDVIGVPEQAAIVVALSGAFLVSTLLQMVLGELFPKNLAISRPLGVALFVTPFTRGFSLVLGPLIRVFDAAARAVTEHVFRVEVTDELEGGHSLDELARIIAASGEEGSLTEEQTTLLRRAVGLGDRRVEEVMIPRPDIVFLAADASLDDLRATARATGHSRFPVQGATEDDIIGSVHVKDLFEVPTDRHATTTVATVASPMLAVPESESLRRLLSDLRRQRRTSALVVDEYGSTAGIVTVEDVLEELVGDIRDEFDSGGHLVRRIGAGQYLVRGGLRVDRAEEIFDGALPDGPYETVAGYVLDRLGHIPEVGEQVVHGSFTLTVARMDGVRITEISVRRQPAATPLEAGDDEPADGGDDDAHRARP
jgi:CBS domain containing-hemolysin-like protein